MIHLRKGVSMAHKLSLVLERTTKNYGVYRDEETGFGKLYLPLGLPERVTYVLEEEPAKV